jgi:hypothetical protein
VNVYRLIEQLCEMGGDARAWLTHLIAELQQLFSAHYIADFTCTRQDWLCDQVWYASKFLCPSVGPLTLGPPYLFASGHHPALGGGWAWNHEKGGRERSHRHTYEKALFHRAKVSGQKEQQKLLGK